MKEKEVISNAFGDYSFEFDEDKTIKEASSENKTIKEKSKKVKCIETGIVYDSSALAAEACGFRSDDGILRCCIGRQIASGGYHWEFAE